jgi:hypothetical protein
MQLTGQEILQSAENMNRVAEQYEAAASHTFGRVGNTVSASDRHSDKSKLDHRGTICTALLNNNQHEI